MGARISLLFMLVLDIESEAAIVSLTKLITVSAAYTLNAATQPLHINLRALLMDICPPQQQATVSLWITRLSATGSVLITSIVFCLSTSFSLLSAVSCTALFSLLALHTLGARYYYRMIEERQAGKLGMWETGCFAARLR